MSRLLKTLTLVAVSGAALSACVVTPYGYRYRAAVVAPAPVAVAPAPPQMGS